MKHYEVICAIIENEKGEFFCCKRGPGRALEGYWEFPGGKVEEHETHEETIIREIKEELDTQIKPLKYLTKVDHVYEDLGEYKGFSITLYAYLCKLVSGNLHISEHTDSAWKTINEMKIMKFAAADQPIVLELEKLINNSYAINA